MSDLYDNTVEANETDSTTTETVTADDTTHLGVDPFEPVTVDTNDDGDPFEPTELQNTETCQY